MSKVDPNQKFTGGCMITIENAKRGVADWPAHIAMENQPLSSFVEAVLTEKGIQSDFEITAFCPQTGHMRVELKPLAN
jgi:hypothetical protein